MGQLEGFFTGNKLFAITGEPRAELIPGQRPRLRSSASSHDEPQTPSWHPRQQSEVDWAWRAAGAPGENGCQVVAGFAARLLDTLWPLDPTCPVLREIQHVTLAPEKSWARKQPIAARHGSRGRKMC